MLDYGFKNFRILANLKPVQIFLRPDLAHHAPSCLLHERRELLPLRNHKSNRGSLGDIFFSHPTQKKVGSLIHTAVGRSNANHDLCGEDNIAFETHQPKTILKKDDPVPSTPNRPHDSRSHRSSNHRCTCQVARSTPAVVRALCTQVVGAHSIHWNLELFGSVRATVATH